MNDNKKYKEGYNMKKKESSKKSTENYKYTFQTPNMLVDELLKDLKPPTFVILVVIIRQTLGWGKPEDGISISQFIKFTGMSRNTITKHTKILQEKGYIVKTKRWKDNGGCDYSHYSLNSKIKWFVHPRERGVVKEIDGDSTGARHTKPTNTKPTTSKKDKTSNWNDQLDAPHLGSALKNNTNGDHYKYFKLISSGGFLEDYGDESDKVSNYFNLYKQFFGFEHPAIKDDQMMRVLEIFSLFENKDYEERDLEFFMDDYFNRDDITSDRNINAFASWLLGFAEIRFPKLYEIG